jgi:hypothetical protein
MEADMINGWTIFTLPDGFEFRFEAVKNGYGEKFYSRDAAERFATSN